MLTEQQAEALGLILADIHTAESLASGDTEEFCNYAISGLTMFLLREGFDVIFKTEPGVECDLTVVKVRQKHG